jgi:hypothetical protein
MLLRVLLGLALATTPSSLLAQESAQEKRQESDDRPVKPEELLALIDQADKIAVYDYADVYNARLLYSSMNAKVISGLKAAMAVAPASKADEATLCMCISYPEIRLYRRQKELARFSLVTGIFVRTTIWSHQARIVDEEKMLRWFDARGIHGPRRESKDRHADEAAEQAGAERWMNAMPASVRPLWPQTMAASPSWENEMSIFVPQRPPEKSKAPAGEATSREPEPAPEIKRLSAALANEFPDPKQRMRALFAWFASGSGAWSGYPAYEGIPEELLLEYTTPELLAAIEGASLSEQEKEGAARFFAGWTFNTRRPRDKALLSPELKRVLLQHCLASPDKDKRQRASLAFGRSN